MNIPGRKRLWRTARWLRSRFVDGALILGYHRIGEPGWDPYSLSVSPHHFAEQLEVLRKHAYTMCLQDLTRALQQGNVPRRAVVVTFDDGYADNLYVAKPLLGRYQVPATVFIVTGRLGGEFWWDEIARLLLAAPAALGSLPLEEDSAAFAVRSDNPSGAVFRKRLPNAQQQRLRALYQRLWPLTDAERQNAMEQLRSWAGAERQTAPSHRTMTVQEVTRLTADGLVEVGAHTVTHPPLATLGGAAQQSEVQGSKAYLETMLGLPVSSFSYPNGSLNKDTISLVRQAGFACACGSMNDVAWHGSNLFHLPRFWVPDVNGERFSRWLQRWLRH
jgi:peptidoglycan/xylan/chitin deacetylase (PgdA/CDA1 family)